MTELPDDDYPAAWRPPERRRLDEARTEFELHVAALSDDELKRIREGNN
jgi:hypothetical protein